MGSGFALERMVSAVQSKAKNMRILIYSANFAPEPTGIGKYSGEMATWLTQHGHSVRVVAAPPYYPAWKIAPDYLWPLYRREQWKGVDIWRAPLWVPKKPGGLSRVLHLVSFAIASFPLMVRQIFWRPHLVVAVAPFFVCAPAALMTARLSGAEAWLHLQDFEVDVAFKMGLLKGSLLQRFVLRMERATLRRFDVVSSISTRMVERLLLKGVKPERTRYFPNWVDISHVKPTSPNGTYRAQLGISPSAMVVLFSGSLGGKQGLMLIPEVARKLAERADVQFVVCGDGVMKPRMEEAAAELKNLHLLPLQPFERLGELLGMADVQLLPQSQNTEDLVLPSKLSGMLASGRPVVATCREGTELHAVVSKCGLVVDPGDSAGVALALTKLADEPGIRLELGRRARAYAEANFERDAILGRVFGPMEDDASAVVNDIIA
jgi:colanic acid biosynthesis glycosyl transferase WcaI